jgi:hypothetical protein
MTDTGAFRSDGSLPPRVGGTLGRYRLEAELGRGGMGVVFRGRDELLQRSAAVKVLSAGLAGDEQFRLRFLREMRLASALEHPNVVPVYEAGLEGEHLYLATRFVDGEDLRDAIRRLGCLPAPRVADIASQLAGALDAAHAHGLVHRDVKPANVLLSSGGEQAFLTDFGLAREAASDTGLTNTGQWMGTVDYVAPEQIEGGGLISARSDIYSMACLLYEALTGRVPYEGGLARKIAGHVTEPLPSVGSQIPRWSAIDAVLRRAAAKDPADRHPSAGDLGRTFAAAVRGERVTVAERSVAIGTALTGIVNDPAPAKTAVQPRVPVHRNVPSTDGGPAVAAADSPRSRALPTVAAVAGIAVVLAVVALLIRPSGESPSTATAGGEADAGRVSTVERVTTVLVTPGETTTTKTAPNRSDAGSGAVAGSGATSEPGNYVQLASFRRSGPASEIARRLRTQAGVEAQVVSSNRFDELLPDFFVVIAGPVDAAGGRRVVRDARSAGISDGFVRPLSPVTARAEPAAIAGTFSGDLKQRSAESASLNKVIPTTMTFESGGRSATISYTSPTCSGTLTLDEVAGVVLRYSERITTGSCVERGTWTIRAHNGQLAAVWRRSGRAEYVSGRLGG